MAHENVDRAPSTHNPLILELSLMSYAHANHLLKYGISDVDINTPSQIYYLYNVVLSHIRASMLRQIYIIRSYQLQHLFTDETMMY